MSNLPEILSTSWKISIQEEIKKNPQITQEKINEIIKWCEKQNYLPPISEHTAALFYHLSKYNIETAQTYIENHYTFRTYYRNIFSDRDPMNKEMVQVMNTINLFMLPGLDNCNRRVLYGSLKSYDTSKFNVNGSIKYIYMILEKDLMNNGFVENGYSVLFDAYGFSLGHLTTISLTTLKQIFSYFLDGANVCIEEINVYNVNSVVEKLIFMIRQITPKHVHERIKLFSKDKAEICLNKYPKTTLPKEMTGENEISKEELYETTKLEVQKYQDWYLTEEKYLRVDESKRPLNKQNKKVIKLQASLSKLELD